MAHDVFVSYSSRDKATADAVCAALESRGIRCWIAPRDILPGVAYGAALVKALRESRLMVLVFSTGANESQQVLREVERAASRGVPIIPLRIEDVVPTAEMEYYIASRHWLDALSPPLEEHLVRLCDTVKTLLAHTSDNAGSPRPEPAIRPVPPHSPEHGLAERQTSGQEPRERNPAAEPPQPISTAPETAATPQPKLSIPAAAHEPDVPTASSKADSPQAIVPVTTVPASRLVREEAIKGNRTVWRWIVPGVVVSLTVVVAAVVLLRRFGPHRPARAAADSTVATTYFFGPRFVPSTSLGRFDGVPCCVEFVPGSDRLLVEAGNRIEEWDVSSGQRIRAVFGLKEKDHFIHSFAVSADGSRIAVGDSHGSLKLIDATNGAEVGTFPFPIANEETARLNPQHPASIDSIAFSPNGKWLAGAGFNSPVIVWDTQSSTPLLQSDTHCVETAYCFMFGLSFSPDGNWLAIATNNEKRNLKRWRTATWQRVKDVTIPDLQNFGITGENGTFVAGTSGHWITIWDLQRGMEIGTLRTPEQPPDSWAVQGLAFDTTGRWLVSRHRDDSIRIWEFASRKLASSIPIGNAEGCTGSIAEATAVSSDGRFLVFDLNTRNPDGSCGSRIEVWKQPD